jgi:hypothetical protein
VTPPEAPNDQQIGDVENYKASEKNSKQQRRSFSSPAISRMFQILQKMHFSTSNIPGKGKNSRRFEAMSQAVEKMRIYPPPSGLSENQKETGSRRAASRPCRAKTPSFRISRVESTGGFSALTGIFFHLTGRFFSQAGPFSTTSGDRWRSP